MNDYEKGYQDACKRIHFMLTGVAMAFNAVGDEETAPDGAMVAAAFNGVARQVAEHAQERRDSLTPTDEEKP